MSRLRMETVEYMPRDKVIHGQDVQICQIHCTFPYFVHVPPT